MRLKLTLVTVLVAGLVIPTALGSAINGTDTTNGVQACISLRTTLGVKTLGSAYHTYGACLSQWAAKAHGARVAATSSCNQRGLHGSALASCITAGTKASLNVSINLTKNAAKACAADLAKMGATAFASTYGVNAHDANAFGKCVSAKPSTKTPPTPTPTPTASNNGPQHFTTTLTALNGSGVSGSGTLLVTGGDKLEVNLSLAGLEPGQPHDVAIGGLPSGNATCPTSSADANHDGVVSLSEAQPSVGNVLATLSTSQQAGEQLTMSSSWLPLPSRTIVVLGETVNGLYDASVPVACGEISAAT
jgi:hypothetical protein